MRKLELDPRTKLFMIFTISLIVMVPAFNTLQIMIRIIVTIIPILLLMVEGKYASSIRFALLYAAALILQHYYLTVKSRGVFSALITGYCSIVVQFMPALITAWFAIRTTKINDFMSAMQKMHVPDGVSISLAVVMRFFPTIKEEYENINDAMRMRGIAMGGGKVTKMIEYRLIPVMFSCVNIGDELSAAAVTRGLGAPIKRTSAKELKLRIIDYTTMAVFTVSTVLFMAAKNIG
ncbi:energy-coupling factor transporter transmembrane component T [Ruminococcus albus]|jgi:energy-coupling factor transport system permease protein|uniref:energy-coupling factor transporter transmembrane component T n=1 Tax=Ruminococcus albus TaxID=1264 RepID=UPI00046598BD|nr:energy-coupling factor transporter transmembrane component T [Ruminococcus albus]MBE6869546.1 energy-coupling factor transporter transmembrane protein EcfT [Ruminococcus albus]